MNHPIWQLDVANNDAALILTPCPGTKGVGLEQSLKELKELGAVAIVTALNNEEMDKAGYQGYLHLQKNSVCLGIINQ